MSTISTLSQNNRKFEGKYIKKLILRIIRNSLKSRIYLYTLVSDGPLVDTKRMILTK